MCEQVLVTIEEKFKENAYTAAQARAVLTFDTESVPVQQFQARCADHILFTSSLQLTKVPTPELHGPQPLPDFHRAENMLVSDQIGYDHRLAVICRCRSVQNKCMTGLFRGSSSHANSSRSYRLLRSVDPRALIICRARYTILDL